jgi:hypothetical protein
MEIAALVFMLVAGGGLAIFVLAVAAMWRRETERATGPVVAPPPTDTIAASLLVHIVSAGSVSSEEAVRQVRRGTGIAAPVTRGIDVSNWAESYGRLATPQQRKDLLEMAVQLVAAGGPVAVRQYAALLDLSFGLGFQTDALARLRELYGFEYIDHAKERRPRSAEGLGDAPLYDRGGKPREELLRVLELSGTPTRQELGAAYRKLVLQHHPDRFHLAPAEEQSRAAARFIEITRAYEELVRTVGANDER